MASAPPTPKHPTDPEQPISNKKPKVSQAAPSLIDPNDFDGILLEYHEQPDKKNKDKKQKSYGSLMASQMLPCNRAHR